MALKYSDLKYNKCFKMRQIFKVDLNFLTKFYNTVYQIGFPQETDFTLKG